MLTAMRNAPSAQTQKPASSTAQPFVLKDYSQPALALPNPVGPYTARTVAPPSLANTGRFEQLMRDGKLYISMNDAVALALENNLDIAIARYNLNIADTDIWRANAGQATRSVNTGVVQGTPAERARAWAVLLPVAVPEVRRQARAAPVLVRRVWLRRPPA
jgi:hypothetical protein